MFDKSYKMWRATSLVKSRDVKSHTEALGFQIRYAHRILVGTHLGETPLSDREGEKERAGEY